MRERLIRMMYGRNGTDELARFLSIAAMVLLLIATFVPGTLSLIIWFFAICSLILAYIRIFSRNIYKRRAENARYLETKRHIISVFRNKKQQFKMRREYCFFKCPGCKITIRIPRGKGNIIITCPRCRESFNAKS